MQIDATSPIKMPPPYGGVPPIICKRPIDANGHVEVTIQLCGVIERTSQFLEVFEVLGNAQSGDEVIIVIDTPGGNVYATQLLVEYMTRCKANVTTVASGLVASAGTIVWFYGKKREVGPWAKFMYHGTSHGAIGRSSEIKEESTELVKFMENILKDMVAAGVLTPAEYDKITACKQDTYITGEAMRKRLLAAMNATEALQILNEEGGEGEGSGAASNKKKAEGSGTGSGDGSGNGDGSGEGDGNGSGGEGSGSGSGAASNKKKAEGSGDGEGSGSGDGSGEGDDGAGEGEGSGAASNKKKAEGSGEGEGGDGSGSGDGEGSGTGGDDDEWASDKYFAGKK